MTSTGDNVAEYEILTVYCLALVRETTLRERQLRVVWPRDEVGWVEGPLQGYRRGGIMSRVGWGMEETQVDLGVGGKDRYGPLGDCRGWERLGRQRVEDRKALEGSESGMGRQRIIDDSALPPIPR